MVTVRKEKNCGTVRITIGAKEVHKLWPEGSPEEAIKRWILLGMNRDVLSSRLENFDHNVKEMGKKLNGLEMTVACLERAQEQTLDLLVKTSKLVAVTSAKDHLEFEVLKKKVDREESLSETERNVFVLTKIKEKVFQDYVDRYVSDLETDTFLATKV